MESIIDRFLELLMAPDVSFRRLHGRVTEKELNLFELASRAMAEPRMVGERIFLYAHRPENFESRNDPGQWCCSLSARLTTLQPVSHASHSVRQKRKCRLRIVQTLRPAANRGGIRYAIRILELRHCSFPRTMFHKASKQCLAARHQAVMSVRE